MITEQQLHFFTLETWRLSQIVLEESEAFAETRDQLKCHTPLVLDPGFLFFLPAQEAKKVASELHRSVENRVRDFNHGLYDLICWRFRWCERREDSFVELLEITAAVADIFGTNGAAALTVLLIKRKFLDKLCNCKVRMP